MSEFRTPLGEEVFKQKYSANQYESWSDRAHVIVNSVCGDHDGTKNNLLSKDDRDQLVRYITKFQFLPGAGTYTTVAVGLECITTATCSKLKRIPEKSGVRCGRT